MGQGDSKPTNQQHQQHQQQQHQQPQQNGSNSNLRSSLNNNNLHQSVGKLNTSYTSSDDDDITSQSSSTSLIYQNIPYTSYSYDRLGSARPLQTSKDGSLSNSNSNSSNNLLSAPASSSSTTASASTNTTNEIITLSKVEQKDEKDQELEKLARLPNFLPLINENDESWFTSEGNVLTIDSMDNRGAVNISIDIQNYLKNSTGYIQEKQKEIMLRMRDVEFRQSAKLANVMSAKVSDATHAQFGFKEVLDKVRTNVAKTRDTVHRIGDLIEALESTLPPDERENFKQEIMAILPSPPASPSSTTTAANIAVAKP
ncbi:hypothetical protein SAMD00019534_029720 [Acytostelium subglobosum LB1]|uniref:hypothetical protein n=1 Tax=Acytostelium subglobosum LB1 TaxID=1410327 RepID=UPI0006451300|nr:hypothetical protein SAMD00019534_029720 [Acytostelium subglobosum LB1]GAM19797.1 hypothetical protein SAMD00019534_029720 [Acytostelium subglobosum LB1]|eukprot:XP_012756559.1 hypothetical protein SAMD00019534_029720 [Acytostelium subglobosum LB1]